MKVAQLMTRAVATCAPGDDMRRAAQLMWDFDCGSIPVVEADRRVAGIITDRDICMAAMSRGRPLDQMRVDSAMAREVRVCHPDETILAAEERMRVAQVRRLPVVDESDRLVGILSLNDIAREALREQPRRRKEVPLEEVATTLATISEPRPEPSAVGRA